MQGTIESIIDEIPSGVIFDSHFVINKLIKEHSNVYLIFAAKYSDTTGSITEIVHQQIGYSIAKISGKIIKKIDQKSWSENIHGKFNKVSCWEKL